MFRVYSFIVLIVPLYVFTGSCQCSNWTLLSCSLLHVHVSVLLYFIEQINDDDDDDDDAQTEKQSRQWVTNCDP